MVITRLLCLEVFCVVHVLPNAKSGSESIKIAPSVSILKCLKLTIDIIFQSHFIAHLTRSNANWHHANPDSGPATTS
jgi:hypothetical protein